MGVTSQIEWTDATWNPWTGCTKISPACDHCYMFRDMYRFGKDGRVVAKSSPTTFFLPNSKNRDGSFKIPSGAKVFTCSWSDWFHKLADEWRSLAWAIVRGRSDVTFQIVTKRTNRIDRCLPDDWDIGYENVWLIATAENQAWLNKRWAELAVIPAVVRGLSIEPLLGPIDLRPIIARTGVIPHWVIVGGESGPQARPMELAWVRDLRNQCFEIGIPFFFKQWGEWIQGSQILSDPAHNLADVVPQTMYRLGKSRAGRLLDGREWNEFPIAVSQVPS